MTRVPVKPEGDRASILKLTDGKEDDLYWFGTLIEKRTDDGELLEMFMEPFEGELDQLIGDNLLYFWKKDDYSYVWAGFEDYPDCEEILLDEDFCVPCSSRGELQRVMEDA